MFPNRVPMGSDTPSPEPLVYFSFIHSFMYVCWSPQIGALLCTYGKKHEVTIHRAPRRRKAYIQWGAAWFPKVIVMKLLSLPQCHTAFSMMPSTLAWVDQSPVSQHVLGQPPSWYTLLLWTTVTASHVTQGRADYESTIPQGTDEGLDLWEVQARACECTHVGMHMCRRVRVCMHQERKIWEILKSILNPLIHINITFTSCSCLVFSWSVASRAVLWAFTWMSICWSQSDKRSYSSL